MSVQAPSPPVTRRRPRVVTVIVFAVVVLAATAGGAYAGMRLLGTTVTAESRLVVGDQSVRAQSVPGYALATQQLAATYARLIGSAPDDTVTASPIPDSAIIRVQAQAADPAAAVDAADAAAADLIRVANAARSQREDEAATTAYLAAVADLRTAKARVTAAATRPAAVRGAAADRVDLAQVRVDAAAEALRDDLRASLSNSAGVSVVQKAQVTTSARPRAALLGGFAGGAGAALLLAAGYLLVRPRSRWR